MICSTLDCASFLREHDNYLILCHQNPDGDTLGCGYGLCKALRSIGKKANVLCHNELPEKFKFLAAGAEDLDFLPETVVAVDIASLQLMGESLLPYADKIDLAIDHHATHDLGAKMQCVVPSASAACEVIYQILLDMGLKISREIAECLYTGIATDTGCFLFSNTTPLTHRIAADLLEYGVDFYRINHELLESKSPAMLKMEQLALENLRYESGGRIVILPITREMIEQAEIPENELDFISGLPKKIKGVDIGVVIKERANEYKVSLRTSENADAAAICVQFGGGGHKRAAGCSFTCGLEEGIEKLIPVLKKELENHNG